MDITSSLAILLMIDKLTSVIDWMHSAFRCSQSHTLLLNCTVAAVALHEYQIDSLCLPIVSQIWITWKLISQIEMQSEGIGKKIGIFISYRKKNKNHIKSCSLIQFSRRILFKFFFLSLLSKKEHTHRQTKKDARNWFFPLKLHSPFRGKMEHIYKIRYVLCKFLRFSNFFTSNNFS